MTASTRCSRVFGPGDRAVLGDVPDEDDRDRPRPWRSPSGARSTRGPGRRCPAGPSSSSTVAVWMESTMSDGRTRRLGPPRRSARCRARRGRSIALGRPARRAGPGGRPGAGPGRPTPRRSRTGPVAGPDPGRARPRPGAGASTCRSPARRRAGSATPARARRRGPDPARRCRSAGAGRRARRCRARAIGAAGRADPGRAATRGRSGGSRTTVSTRLFQAPQVRHWPSQRRNGVAAGLADVAALWPWPRQPGRPVELRRPRRASRGSAAWMSRPASGSLSTTIVVPGS